MTTQVMGMLLIKKPEGKTSFQTLNYYKKAFNTKRLGHTGTLDKFATGLMVALVGSATRLAQYITLADKTYVADFSFGTETATLDPEGAIVRTAPCPKLSDIEAILPQFIGPIMQAPPVYSAIHIDGKRAYERTLDGEELIMEPRPVTIRRLELISFDGQRGRFLVDCSKGTYIRSLARDMANAIGSAAHVCALDRTAVGPYSVSEAHDPESGVEPTLLGAAAVLKGLPGFVPVVIPESDQSIIRNGKMYVPQTDNSLVALVSDDDRLLGLMEKKESKWEYLSVFPW